jgi:hypothetical protein
MKILSYEIFKFEQVTDLSIQHNLTHNAYKVNPFWTCLFMILFMLYSCSTKMTPVFNDENEDLLKRSSQILYITIQAKKDTIQNRINTEIVQYQISNGKLKFTENDHTAKETPGSWKICLMDARERILYCRHIANPLIFRSESFNENGRIEQHTSAIHQTQIPLRFPWVKQMKIIQIDTLVLSGKTERIFIQKTDEIQAAYK